jgi:hypothetical protein
MRRRMRRLRVGLRVLGEAVSGVRGVGGRGVGCGGVWVVGEFGSGNPDRCVDRIVGDAGRIVVGR